MIFVILAAFLKIGFDVLDDKKDLEMLSTGNNGLTEMEYQKKLSICEDKKYFEPLCQSLRLSHKISKGEGITQEDCQNIEFNGLPYYMNFHGKEEFVEFVTEIKAGCSFGASGMVVMN